MLNYYILHQIIGGMNMIDVKTIDETTEFSFKDMESKKRWINLVETKYFEDYQMRIIMDFTRRWGKVMQHIMKTQKKSLPAVIVLSAKAVNIDNTMTLKYLDKSIIYLTEMWSYGNEFREWINNGGITAIKKHF